MRQKNVSIINTVWFRHIQPKTERKPRATPFYNVSFRSCTVPFRFVSFGTVRGVPRVAQVPLCFAEESPARWSTFRSPDAILCSRPPPHDKEKPWDAFFQSRRSPQIANRVRVRRSLPARSRCINETERNETKRNDSLGKTERYRRRKRQTKRTVITVLWNGTAR